jgi:ATP-dependent RNA helicase MSS116
MQAWQSWLGFYNSHLKLLRWDKHELVAQANAYTPALGLDEPPALLRKTIGMMGLKGIAGLKIDDSPGGGQRGGSGHGGHTHRGSAGTQGDGLFRSHAEQRQQKPKAQTHVGGFGHGHGRQGRGSGRRH